MVVLQIAGAVELQVTCPFVVPFNQASQVQTFPALKHLAYLLAKTPFSLLVQVACCRAEGSSGSLLGLKGEACLGLFIR